MEKRLVSFFVAATLVVMGYSMLQRAVLGPPPAPEAAQVADGELAEPAAAPADDVDPSDPTQPASEATPEAAVVDEQADAEATRAKNEDGLEQVELPKRLMTAGSLDPSSGYRMLVYFSNQGAAVDRVVLNSPQYRDLDNRAGYLGYLALTDAKDGGCRVNVVGEATPASIAKGSAGQVGLRGPTFSEDEQSVLSVPGDRITAIDETAVDNAVEFHQSLSRTKPGDTVELTVYRPDESGKETRLTFRVALIKAPLAVIATEPTHPTESESRHPSSYLLTLNRLGEARTKFKQDEIAGLPSLHHENWSVRAIPHGVEFRHVISRDDFEGIGETGELQIVKRFRLFKGGSGDESDAAKEAQAYSIDFDIECANLGERPLQIGYQLDGPTGMTTEGWWYSYKVHPKRFVGAGARDVIWRAQGDTHELQTCSQITKHAKKAAEDSEDPSSPLFAATEPEPMQYIGCDTQYFASVLQVAEGGDPSAAKLASAVARAVGPLDKKMKKTDVSFRVQSETVEVPPAGKLSHSFTIFTGPKDSRILSQLGLQDCIVFGWFGAVSKPMLAMLHGLYWITGKFSYGIAIILLTLIVRACMFPLGRKMALNAQKMQELAPEMKKIADKYKNDMEKRGQAQRDLFAKHKYNPFSGCLVMFIQMPIFLGLYRGLSCDIALRQAPLIPGIEWCSNLAGPDKFWNWQSVVPAFMSNPYGIFGLGPFLNILPLVTVGLFLMQHKLFTPPPQDEQQQMQHSVMKFMMLFMGILFHKVAAGLCLYLITSTIWGLAERTMLPKPKPPGSTDASGDTDGGVRAKSAKPKPSPNGRNGASNGAAKKNRRKKNKKR